MAEYKLVILTPRGKFLEENVESFKFDNSIGKIEILPGHINYMSEALPSIVEIRQKDIIKKAVITGGVVEFSNGRLVVMADTAEWPEQIDLQRAEDALARAKDRISSRDAAIDTKRAELALQRAIMRIKCGEMNEH